MFSRQLRLYGATRMKMKVISHCQSPFFRDLFVDSWTEDSERPCRYVLSPVLSQRGQLQRGAGGASNDEARL